MPIKVEEISDVLKLVNVKNLLDQIMTMMLSTLISDSSEIHRTVEHPVIRNVKQIISTKDYNLPQKKINFVSKYKLWGQKYL